MVSVGKVVHGFKLFIDDTDAGFVGAVDHILDIFGGLSHLLRSCINSFGCLNRSLRVKFRCSYMSIVIRS